LYISREVEMGIVFKCRKTNNNLCVFQTNVHAYEKVGQLWYEEP